MATSKLRTLSALIAACVALGILCALAVLPIVGTAGLGARSAADYWLSLPSELIEPPLPQTSTVYAADGTTRLATMFTFNRKVVPIGAIAPTMQHAIVDVEDARFYQHGALDTRGIARAIRDNLTGNSGGLQGASTLTQQYVKNTLLLIAQTSGDPTQIADATAQTVDRKLREAKLAIGVEAKYSKTEILGRYLNIAYFGAGAYGVEAASVRYFGVHASQLSIPQAATLAGLVKNPEGYNPIEHPQAGRDRRNIVLDRMRTAGDLTAAELTADQAAPLGLHPVTPPAGCESAVAPFFCQWVIDHLSHDPGLGATDAIRQARIAQGGLRVVTSLDLRTQDAAQRAVDAVLPRTDRVGSAVVIVQPGTGLVKAIAVNRNYGTAPGDTEVPLATTPAYQGGSTFKAFTLAAALEAGIPITSPLPGGDRYTSTIFDNPAAGYFRNDGDGEGANLTIASATAKSVNTAYVQLEEKVGVLAVADAAIRAGVTSLPHTGDNRITAREGAFTLGTRGVSPLDMAESYATFAAHGIACTAQGIMSITASDGTVLDTGTHSCRQAFTPAVADTVVATLAGVLAPGGTGLSAAMPGRPAAGKTGTTDNYGAAWFVGLTPQLAGAVWMGDPRGQAYPLINLQGVARVYGGTLPARIWKQAMTDALAGQPALPLPAIDPSYLATSSGPLLPSVVGQPAGRATALLAASGAVVTVTRAAAPPQLPSGTVMTQSPSPGARLAAGEPVTLTVAN